MGSAALGMGALDNAAEGTGAKNAGAAAGGVSAGTNDSSEEPPDGTRIEGSARRSAFRTEACWARSEAETVSARSEKSRSRFI